MVEKRWWQFQYDKSWYAQKSTCHPSVKVRTFCAQQLTLRQKCRILLLISNPYCFPENRERNPKPYLCISICYINRSAPLDKALELDQYILPLQQLYGKPNAHFFHEKCPPTADAFWPQTPEKFNWKASWFIHGKSPPFFGEEKSNLVGPMEGK